MNLKWVYRLYREERLTVRKRRGRKRALGTRAPMAVPHAPNQRWSLDFVSDSLACGDAAEGSRPAPVGTPLRTKIGTKNQTVIEHSEGVPVVRRFTIWATGSGID